MERDLKIESAALEIILRGSELRNCAPAERNSRLIDICQRIGVNEESYPEVSVRIVEASVHRYLVRNNFSEQSRIVAIREVNRFFNQWSVAAWWGEIKRRVRIIKG